MDAILVNIANILDFHNGIFQLLLISFKSFFSLNHFKSCFLFCQHLNILRFCYYFHSSIFVIEFMQLFIKFLATHTK